MIKSDPGTVFVFHKLNLIIYLVQYIKGILNQAILIYTIITMIKI